MDPDDADLTVTEIGSGGVGFSLPQHIAALCLPVVKASFADSPDAQNYLEMKVVDQPTGDQYVLIFARSTRQTPHELRLAAEAKHDRLLAELDTIAATHSGDPSGLARAVTGILDRTSPFDPTAR